MVYELIDDVFGNPPLVVYWVLLWSFTSFTFSKMFSTPHASAIIVGGPEFLVDFVGKINGTFAIEIKRKGEDIFDTYRNFSTPLKEVIILAIAKSISEYVGSELDAREIGYYLLDKKGEISNGVNVTLGAESHGFGEFSKE